MGRSPIRHRTRQSWGGTAGTMLVGKRTTKRRPFPTSLIISSLYVIIARVTRSTPDPNKFTLIMATATSGLPPPPAYTVSGTTTATAAVGGASAINPWDLYCADNELKPDVVQDLVSILCEIKVVLLLDDSK